MKAEMVAVNLIQGNYYSEIDVIRMADDVLVQYRVGDSGASKAYVDDNKIFRFKINSFVSEKNVIIPCNGTLEPRLRLRYDACNDKLMFVDLTCPTSGVTFSEFASSPILSLRLPEQGYKASNVDYITEDIDGSTANFVNGLTNVELIDILCKCA